MNMSAYSLALNTYFRKKKSVAVGYASTLMGFGPILMPQLITILMEIHTVQGTTLILGGVVANTLVAASLLHPVKWHMIEEIVEEVITQEETQEEKSPMMENVELNRNSTDCRHLVNFNTLFLL